MEYLLLHILNADDIIVNTNLLKMIFLQLFNELSLTAKPACNRTVLTFQLRKKSLNQWNRPDSFDIVKKESFFLQLVLQSEKNHKVMIEAYEKYFSSFRWKYKSCL